MSYRGLGQAKIVPGQINFATLPPGQTALPSLEPLVRAGLPIAPYIEHGSWETGEPAIMRYGLDPYRGIMGLGQGGGAAEAQSMKFEVVVPGEPRGSFLFEELLEAVDAAAMLHGQKGRQSRVVSPPGSENIVADVDTAGRVRMLHGLGQSIGQSIRRLENQSYRVIPDTWARTAAGAGRYVRGMDAAMKTAKRLLRENPRTTIRVFAEGTGLMMPGSEVVAIQRQPGGGIDVRFNYHLSGGLGQALTDLVCSETAVAGSWRARVVGGLNAGAQAALLGAAAAGFIGALIGKPVIAAAAGAAIGWSGYSIWTATYRV